MVKIGADFPKNRPPGQVQYLKITNPGEPGLLNKGLKIKGRLQHSNLVDDLDVIAAAPHAWL